MFDGLDITNLGYHELWQKTTTTISCEIQVDNRHMSECLGAKKSCNNIFLVLSF